MSGTLKPTGAFWLWLGVTAMAIGVFVDITRELLEGEVDAIDRAIVLAVARVRTPWVTVAAVDLTALGSITVVALFSILAVVTLLVLRDRRGALQILSAFGGAVLWTQVMKDLIDRPRPAVVPRLVSVSGFSYPSGHSLAAASVYLTISILVSQHLQTTRARIAVFAVAGFIIMLVALSRVYLGVHYPTDVAGGIALGGAWAFLLASAFSLRDRRAQL
jgi:undecaprenyl-diphosphatase